MVAEARPLTEDQFAEVVIALAQYGQWMVTHFRPAQVRPGKWVTPLTGDRGFPDLVLARDGEVLIVELKSQTGRIGPGQREWAAAIGAQHRWWRPSDMPEIKATLLRSRATS